MTLWKDDIRPYSRLMETGIANMIIIAFNCPTIKIFRLYASNRYTMHHCLAEIEFSHRDRFSLFFFFLEVSGCFFCDFFSKNILCFC